MSSATSERASPPGIPDEWHHHLVAQDYARYDDEDQIIWRDLLTETQGLIERYREKLHPAYLEGFNRLILPWRSIPRLADIDGILAGFGWRTVSVDGYIPADVYAGLMTHGIFPVSRNLRQRAHIGFSPVPDMAHDLFGHIPMLVSTAHREFLLRLARAMASAKGNRWDDELYEANRAMARLRCQDDCPEWALINAEERVERVQARLKYEPSRLTELSRMYLWSTEFGLMGDEESFHVYGAGLLSSTSELDLVCSGRASLVPYTKDVVKHDIYFSDPQTRYFVARDYGELHDVLTAYEESAKC